MVKLIGIGKRSELVINLLFFQTQAAEGFLGTERGNFDQFSGQWDYLPRT